MKLHRSDGPALIWYYKNGQLESEQWAIDYKSHRLDGPARIWYYHDGQIVEEFAINDIDLSEEEFNNRISTKEMTIAEIKSALGHKVKVVK